MKFAMTILALATSTVEAGMSGQATTTRYWDCNGGSCGCGFGSGGRNTMCQSNALYRAPSNSYGAEFYGTAAVS